MPVESKPGQCFTEHGSADAVAICMLLLQPGMPGVSCVRRIAPFVKQQVEEKVRALGIEVIGFGIRDIILPGDVKEIMNQVLVTEKKAQANIIMRREETASTRSLLNTAKLMEENAMLWKLKEMEYVERIAEKINNISVSGNGKLVEQLKDIFITG